MDNDHEPENWTPEQEAEAAAWDEATRLTELVQGGTDDPDQAADAAAAAGAAWTRAAAATRAAIASLS